MFVLQQSIKEGSLITFFAYDHELIRPLIVFMLQVVVDDLAGQVDLAGGLDHVFRRQRGELVRRQEHVQVVALEIWRQVHRQDLTQCQRQFREDWPGTTRGVWRRR